MANGSQFANANNSFSGVDIRATFNGVTVAELQAISYSIKREKAPIYTMGSPDPRGFSRGKRGIAGTLVCVMFDRNVLLGAFGIYQSDLNKQMLFLSDIDDVRPEASVTSDVFASNLTTASLTEVGATVENAETALTSIDSDQEVAAPWYVDQIPPLDVTLAAANEYGHLSVMRIAGVEMLDEGYGVSIDDMLSEMQHTYVARNMQGWRPLASRPLVRPQA